MQVLYGYDDPEPGSAAEGLHMGKLHDRRVKWNSDYHEIVGWTIEENVFPINYENIETDQALALADFGEERHMWIFSKVHDRIIAAARSSHATFLRPDLELYVYYFYCQTLFAVLENFSGMMERDLRSTSYYSEYQCEIEVFRRLIDQLTNENRDSVAYIPPLTLVDIRSVAENLAAEWQRSVFTAVEHFENVHLE